MNLFVDLVDLKSTDAVLLAKLTFLCPIEAYEFTQGCNPENLSAKAVWHTVLH
jgi:hypothetical protein